MQVSSFNPSLRFLSRFPSTRALKYHVRRISRERSEHRANSVLQQMRRGHGGNSCRENLHPLPGWHPSTDARGSGTAPLPGSAMGTSRRCPSHRAKLPISQFSRGAELRGQRQRTAEAQGHHPDINFGWGYATVSLRTKKIKGLHENDFIMAAKI